MADCEVYAWGNNAMGQCGLGHCQGPVTSPKLITALRGGRVQQISAGTSHSLAWTAIPSDRYVAVCFCVRYQLNSLAAFYVKLEMWANAQRDGCTAKHRWRPLFNAAKFG